MHDVWTGSVIAQLRADLNVGGSTFCGRLPAQAAAEERRTAAAPSLDAGPQPSRLVQSMCTAACNISLRRGVLRPW